MKIPDLSDPLAVRGVFVASGILMALFGSHLYQVAVLAPGLIGGLWGGLLLGRSVGLENSHTLILCGLLATTGALLCHFVENLAVRLTGAVAFGSAGWLGWPMVRPDKLEAVGAVVVAALIGAAVFPRIHTWAVRLATSGMGGYLIAEAAQRPQNLYIIGGVMVAGTVAQSVPWRLPSSPAPEVKAEKKKKKK